MVSTGIRTLCVEEFRRGEDKGVTDELRTPGRVTRRSTGIPLLLCYV